MIKILFMVVLVFVIGPISVFAQSRDGSKVVAPSRSTITDSGGAKWGFNSKDPKFPLDYFVTKNGAKVHAEGFPAEINWSMSQLLILFDGTSHNLYATDDHYGPPLAYMWNGSTFVGIPALPSGPVVMKFNNLVPSISTNSPTGTRVATTQIAMADGSTFNGTLISSDPMFNFNGLDVVTSRVLLPTDNGLHNVNITVK